MILGVCDYDNHYVTLLSGQAWFPSSHLEKMKFLLK